MRSADLEQLINDLRAEDPRSHVVTQAESKVIVLIEDADNTRHTFTAQEARLLLSSPLSVKRLFEALEYPEEVFVELHGVEVDNDVMQELESYASTVDEM